MYYVLWITRIRLRHLIITSCTIHNHMRPYTILWLSIQHYIPSHLFYDYPHCLITKLCMYIVPQRYTRSLLSDV